MKKLVFLMVGGIALTLISGMINIHKFINDALLKDALNSFLFYIIFSIVFVFLALANKGKGSNLNKSQDTLSTTNKSYASAYNRKSYYTKDDNYDISSIDDICTNPAYYYLPCNIYYDIYNSNDDIMTDPSYSYLPCNIYHDSSIDPFTCYNTDDHSFHTFDDCTNSFDSWGDNDSFSSWDSSNGDW